MPLVDCHRRAFHENYCWLFKTEPKAKFDKPTVREKNETKAKINYKNKFNSFLVRYLWVHLVFSIFLFFCYYYYSFDLILIWKKTKTSITYNKIPLNDVLCVYLARIPFSPFSSSINRWVYVSKVLASPFSIRLQENVKEQAEEKNKKKSHANINISIETNGWKRVCDSS